MRSHTPSKASSGSHNAETVEVVQQSCARPRRSGGKGRSALERGIPEQSASVDTPHLRAAVLYAYRVSISGEQLFEGQLPRILDHVIHADQPSRFGVRRGYDLAWSNERQRLGWSKSLGKGHVVHFIDRVQQGDLRGYLPDRAEIDDLKRSSNRL